MIAWTEITATKSRQDILDDAGIKYVVDQDFNLGFKSHNDLMTAIHLLESALEWCSNEKLFKEGRMPL